MGLAARSPWLRLTGLAGVPLAMTAIVLAYSRGALVGLAVLAVFALLFVHQRVPALLSLALIGLLGSAIAPEMVIDRLGPAREAGDAILQGRQTTVSDPALAQRLSAMQAAPKIFMDFAIVGVGTGQFAALYPSYALTHGSTSARRQRCTAGFSRRPPRAASWV